MRSRIRASKGRRRACNKESKDVFVNRGIKKKVHVYVFSAGFYPGAWYDDSNQVWYDLPYGVLNTLEKKVAHRG